MIKTKTMKLLPKIFLLQLKYKNYDDGYYRLWFNGMVIITFQSLNNKKKLVNHARLIDEKENMIYCYKNLAKQNLKLG